MNSRRLIQWLSMRVLDLILPTKYHRLWRICKFLIGDIILAMLVFCIVVMYNNRNNLSICLLIYLFVVYYLIFGLKIGPFLRFICEIRGAFFNALPSHCCAVQAQAIRDEIELLRNDFNNRLKQIIFTSVFNAYYAGFLPCFFATAIHYNVWCCMQHIILI
ncbi:transmembrane protein 39A-B-like [Glossina fuscipes]|uniref:Transmembrane protein 39A-B-like n=1 Tax=Glossina fuscipes TaxID=7396 RepID=A0A9C5Z6G3_9MUSC|nr:transmembrane protein 39A-B-like [Glossina fuscipes]